MNGRDKVDQQIYNRNLLLNGEKRNEVLDLWEVQRYGLDSYGDVNYVSVYGLSPADCMRKGLGSSVEL